jgi:hypothetical protein
LRLEQLPSNRAAPSRHITFATFAELLDLIGRVGQLLIAQAHDYGMTNKFAPIRRRIFRCIFLDLDKVG